MPIVLSNPVRIELVVAFTWCKQFADKFASRDICWKCKKFFDVCVETFPSTIRDGICYVSYWTRHERQHPLAAGRSNRFFWKLLEERDLKVIELLVDTRELPMSTVLHLAFYNVPILVVFENVSWYRGGHWSE